MYIIIIEYFSSLHKLMMFKDICKWDLLPNAAVTPLRISVPSAAALCDFREKQRDVDPVTAT